MVLELENFCEFLQKVIAMPNSCAVYEKMLFFTEPTKCTKFQCYVVLPNICYNKEVTYNYLLKVKYIEFGEC